MSSPKWLSRIPTDVVNNEIGKPQNKELVMNLRSTFKSAAGWFGADRNRRTRPSEKWTRLMLEALEQRDVPSTFGADITQIQGDFSIAYDNTVLIPPDINSISTDINNLANATNSTSAVQAVFQLQSDMNQESLFHLNDSTYLSNNPTLLRDLNELLGDVNSGNTTLSGQSSGLLSQLFGNNGGFNSPSPDGSGSLPGLPGLSSTPSVAVGTSQALSSALNPPSFGNSSDPASDTPIGTGNIQGNQQFYPNAIGEGLAQSTPMGTNNLNQLFANAGFPVANPSATAVYGYLPAGANGSGNTVQQDLAGQSTLSAANNLQGGEQSLNLNLSMLNNMLGGSSGLGSLGSLLGGGSGGASQGGGSYVNVGSSPTYSVGSSGYGGAPSSSQQNYGFGQVSSPIGNMTSTANNLGSILGAFATPETGYGNAQPGYLQQPSYGYGGFGSYGPPPPMTIGNASDQMGLGNLFGEPSFGPYGSAYGPSGIYGYPG